MRRGRRARGFLHGTRAFGRLEGLHNGWSGCCSRRGKALHAVRCYTTPSLLTNLKRTNSMVAPSSRKPLATSSSASSSASVCREDLVRFLPADDTDDEDEKPAIVAAVAVVLPPPSPWPSPSPSTSCCCHPASEPSARAAWRRSPSTRSFPFPLPLPLLDVDLRGRFGVGGCGGGAWSPTSAS